MTIEFHLFPSIQEKSQANAIVERIYHTIGKLIHTFKIQQMDLDNESPWEWILSSTMFAILSFVHSLYTIINGIWWGWNPKNQPGSQKKMEINWIAKPSAN